MTEKFSMKKLLEKTCVEKNIPFFVVFELTYRCNHSCRHCYTMEREQKELTLKEITSIFDQLVEMGTFNLAFTGGEILARGDFFEIAMYARERGFSIGLLTNGTLITEEEADKLKSLKPVGVEISLLGASPSIHDYITNRPGSFNRAIQAIKLLVKRNIRVVAKTTLMKPNVREYKAIKSLAKDLGAIPNIGPGIIPKIDGSTQPLRYELSWKERTTHIRDENLNMNFMPEDDTPTNMLTCKAGKAMASISPYGEVQPCILMPLKLGNLREKNFKEIWYSNENQTLNQQRTITSSDLMTCINCKKISFCTRCPGVAYIETKNLFAPSPTACENAKWKAYQKEKYKTKGGEIL